MKFDDLMISHNLSFVKKNKSSAIEKHQFLISAIIPQGSLPSAEIE